MSKERGIADDATVTARGQFAIRGRVGLVRRAARPVDHAAHRARGAPPDHLRLPPRRSSTCCAPYARTSPTRGSWSLPVAPTWCSPTTWTTSSSSTWRTPRSRSRAPSCAPRRARCGTTSSSPRSPTDSAAWSACPASPESAGATPVQNVGAYGAEVADTISGVRLLDRRTGTDRWVSPDALGFGYRHSVLKNSQDAVVLEVEFTLAADGRSAPLRYGELASALGVEPGSRADPTLVREAVLSLRRQQGHGARRRRPRHLERRLLLHQPGRHAGRVRAAPVRDRRARAQLPGAGRREAGGGLAGRARRVRQGLPG